MMVLLLPGSKKEEEAKLFLRDSKTSFTFYFSIPLHVCFSARPSGRPSVRLTACSCSYSLPPLALSSLCNWLANRIRIQIATAIQYDGELSLSSWSTSSFSCCMGNGIFTRWFFPSYYLFLCSCIKNFTLPYSTTVVLYKNEINKLELFF